ncbi:sperm acrosome membrane-associated protein 4-like [Acipenser ruthenus]|uniref:sperm acrosome membrane-associated protein 4-like n=1 Tax=Acipenser ruthenus TaxID=7906 RepID=UPI00145A311C|nr:sperm acrosome membrane-associated protein 4-like [Acipenser ruthenus]XP_033912094.1 sperm acrosome membrane-associated protein 4-like [Acipenser ruthenus]
MNKIMFVGALVLACVVMGQALQCYKCDLGVFGICSKSIINCTGATDKCYNANGKSASLLLVQEKGCVALTSCNTNNNNTVFQQVVYSITKVCCDGELCNSGATVGVSVLAGIAMVTVWLTSLL